MSGRYLLMSAALAMFAGCGFHLREAPVLPPEMRSLYIVSSGQNAELVRDLRRGLESETTSVLDDPTRATATLSIINVSQSSRALVVNRRGQPLEYQVAFTTSYTFIAGGVVLIPPEVLTLTRNYDYSVTNAIANQEQEDALFASLAKQMSQLIIFRIQAVARSLPPLPATAPLAASAAPAQAAHDISHAPAIVVPPAATRPRPPVVE
ncbi:MAG TPA: LPS assembly lipoprotein LptE [Gammaproteobacteria bacterium]|nr:LPS assembly lipoprotein LptE [Gammaproteobacteria bacterium]